MSDRPENAPEGLGRTPTAEFASAIAASPDRVAWLTVPFALGEEGILLAVLDAREAFENERAYRPELRLALVDGMDLDLPEVACVFVAWSAADGTPEALLELDAPIFGGGGEEW